jgi:hypothetical protein
MDIGGWVTLQITIWGPEASKIQLFSSRTERFTADNCLYSGVSLPKCFPFVKRPPIPHDELKEYPPV